MAKHKMLPFGILFIEHGSQRPKSRVRDSAAPTGPGIEFAGIPQMVGYLCVSKPPAALFIDVKYVFPINPNCCKARSKYNLDHAAISWGQQVPMPKNKITSPLSNLCMRQVER